jgi:tRNA pseudouridine55 synthase
VEEEKDTSFLTPDQVAEVVRAMVGTLLLPVPRWSAVRVGGKRLYHLARQGKAPVTLPLRPMEVRDATLLAFERNPHLDTPHLRHARVVWQVSAGTYIRSLARELGRRLGVPASLCGLRRTAIGPYSIHDPRVISLPKA